MHLRNIKHEDLTSAIVVNVRPEVNTVIIYGSGHPGRLLVNLRIFTGDVLYNPTNRDMQIFHLLRIVTGKCSRGDWLAQSNSLLPNCINAPCD